MRAIVVVVAGLMVVAGAGEAFAARREPCSGKKGGVERCEAGKFVCRNGSKSASKKICERPAT